MLTIKKEVLKDKKNVSVGTILQLSGEVGYGVDDATFGELKDAIKSLLALLESDVVIIDVRDLEYWDSLALRAVFDKIEPINQKIKKQGGIPVCFIGSKTKDVFAAACERFPSNRTGVTPWYKDIEEYLNKYDV